MISKLATYVACAGALLAQGLEAQDVKGNMTQTQVIIPGQKPSTRNEIMLSNMPVNSDFYNYWEGRDNTNVYKLRFQSLPLSYGPLSLGAAAQHSNFGTPGQEIGGVLRASDKWGTTTAKADLRYFPSRKTYDWYGLVNMESLYADVLGSYNASLKTLNVRPGFDLKISKNFQAGLEGKYLANLKGKKIDYVGFRGKLVF